MANDPSWYLNRPQGKSGPHTWAELQSLAAQGQVSPQDGVWSPAAQCWLRAAQVPGLLPAPAARPRPNRTPLYLGIGCGVLGLAALCCLAVILLLPRSSPDTPSRTRLGTLSVDSSGGSFSADGISLTVPPGSAPESLELELFREDSDPTEVEGSDYRSRGVILSGPLESLQGPLQIGLSVPDEYLSSGDTYLILEEEVLSPSGGPAVNVRVLPTQVDAEAGQLLAVLENSGTGPVGMSSGAGVLAAQARRPAAQAAAPTAVTIRAENGWVFDGFVSDHFRVSYRGRVVSAEMVRRGVELLEEQRQLIEDYNFTFTGVTVTEVTLQPLKDKAGLFVPSRLGASSCTLQLANRFFYDEGFFTDQYTELQATVGHELLHLAQFTADPRWAATKAVSPLPTLWLDEAASTWFEAAAVGNPDYISPNAQQNVRFFENPLFGAPLDQAQNHGYGASFFLRALAARYGERWVAEIYNQLRAGTPSGTANEALYNALDQQGSSPGLEWVPFLETFFTTPYILSADFGGPPISHAAAIQAARTADGSDYTVSFTPNQKLNAAASTASGTLLAGEPASLQASFSLGGLSAAALSLSFSEKDDTLEAFTQPSQVIIAVDAPADAGVLVYGLESSSGLYYPLAGAPFAYLSSRDPASQTGSQMFIEDFGPDGSGSGLSQLLLIPFNSRSSLRDPNQTANITLQITFLGSLLPPPVVDDNPPPEEFPTEPPPADNPTTPPESSHVCQGMTVETLRSPLMHTSRCWLTCFGIGSGTPSDAEIQACIDANQ